MAASNQVINVFNTNALQSPNNYLKQFKNSFFNKTHIKVNQLSSAFYTAENLTVINRQMTSSFKLCKQKQISDISICSSEYIVHLTVLTTEGWCATCVEVLPAGEAAVHVGPISHDATSVFPAIQTVAALKRLLQTTRRDLFVIRTFSNRLFFSWPFLRPRHYDISPPVHNLTFLIQSLQNKIICIMNINGSTHIWTVN